MLTVVARRTNTLDEADRNAVIQLCIAAHENEDFQHLFTHYMPPDGLHLLGSDDGRLIAWHVAYAPSASERPKRANTSTRPRLMWPSAGTRSIENTW